MLFSLADCRPRMDSTALTANLGPPTMPRCQASILALPVSVRLASRWHPDAFINTSCDLEHLADFSLTAKIMFIVDYKQSRKWLSLPIYLSIYPWEYWYLTVGFWHTSCLPKVSIVSWQVKVAWEWPARRGQRSRGQSQAQVQGSCFT